METHHLGGPKELLELAESREKIILEIGFGNGENTSFLAAKNPNALIIASEVYLSGIGSLLNSIAQNSLNNIKIYDDDVRELILNLPKNILMKFILFALIHGLKRDIINVGLLNMSS